MTAPAIPGSGPTAGRFDGVAFDRDDVDLASALDELPLWSAPFGLALLDTVDLRPSATNWHRTCRRATCGRWGLRSDWRRTRNCCFSTNRLPA